MFGKVSVNFERHRNYIEMSKGESRRRAQIRDENFDSFGWLESYDSLISISIWFVSIKMIHFIAEKYVMLIRLVKRLVLNIDFALYVDESLINH